MCHKILIIAEHLSRVENKTDLPKNGTLLSEKEFIMPKIIDFDLSEPLAKTLIGYASQTKNSMNAQSLIVEEALIEFFERHKVKIEA